ncbi:carboxylesterase family protein [Luteibaculum oceani]|nr:carboxylesterase family protein [Luteibaculum oceani]
MRKITTLYLLFFLISVSIQAQSLRYFDKLFTKVAVDSNIFYGANYDYDNLDNQHGTNLDSLHMDIYYPEGDQETKRPLIIWVHGGYFLKGSKLDEDITYFCNEFAARGFVTAAINYRLGFEMPIDSINAVRAVYRAIQDGRAAVRFLRSKANDYGIDKERVYMGGTSAGSFVALNLAYFNLPEEVPDYLDTNERLSINEKRGFGLDGLEGLTNTIEESSKIQGIININGATKTVKWMDDAYSSSVPLISLHGTADSTVPYGTRVINVADVQTELPKDPPVPLIGVQGSYDMDWHADTMGYTSRLYTWYGAGHSPHLGYKENDTAKAYLDTIMSFTVKHIYQDFLGGSTVPGLEENERPCDYNNGDFYPCKTSSLGEEYQKSSIALYPVPMGDETQFNLPGNVKVDEVWAMDMLGRKISLDLITGNSIDTEKLKPGNYLILLKTSSGELHRIKAIK